ncbi:YopT-type cysteine protease domain-containing protein [Dyella acidisoli]|uniref:Peptidase C58 YopT-type domain-containing protein n=1 Tax=Dyella acidisoli TaxID=1867834 RepID=A0ABQ5XRT2_9GAMM|nr:YopT-type cysteine protease domain-containing protein [Dyella acidisoli]GLQ94462.1 hypothetical protein GCM10007901_34140 [Dyella acidisoli]
MSTLTDCRVKSWNQTTQIIDAAFPHALDLKGGVCYGSCVEWLKRLRQVPHESPDHRMAYVSSQAKLIGGRQRLYESAQRDVKARTDDFTAAVHFQVMNRLIQIGKFGMSIEFVDGGAEFTQLADALPAMRNGNMPYAMINISTLSGGHAICAQNADSIRLFDPNFGEFVIGDGDLEAFFGDLSLASALTGNMYLFVNVAQVSFA